MAIIKAQIFGRSLVGVFLTANNSYILYPPTLLKPQLKKFKSVFQEPFYPLTINNSNLLGVYSASNKYGIIVPHIIREDELNNLKSYMNDSSNIGVLKSIDNAFGNLILCNDKGAIISSFLESYKSEIEDILNVETVIYEFADYYLPGSISLANNYGCLVHPLSTDEQIEFIASILKVEEVDVSTVNRGVPYLSSGAIVNDKSGIFGSYCTGPEMMRITSVLQI
ncbi:MAG: translation initiation factor IF-6 [Candidatus Lokiarchaeota archaeon]|nr:translation initiation factor IF-6 [Candidatus Lokiarchaeota archaeon]MCK4480142.1 translation initiation factor IF-6 [Candidatus Lokiarchaeota archaeon]